MMESHIWAWKLSYDHAGAADTRSGKRRGEDGQSTVRV